MSKRAVIYVRVSSEQQADKVSPQAQESDCREYCLQRNYQVVEIYRDIAQYRIGGKLVEPSGTRTDRPEFKRMLADGEYGRFDIIIAWREDRLYRGLRPMLDIIDCIDKNKLDIELVKETFDKRMAPFKAQIARMELDGKLDRFMMGVSGRFSKGKPWTSAIPYGYMENGAGLEINPVEAEWVRNIYEWHGNSVPIREIRRRLVEAGAPERTKNEIPWRIARLYFILRNPTYTTGIQVINWDGKVFEIPYPILIDPETAQREEERKARSKANPARNLKYHYLGQGLVYCAACNKKMTSYTAKRYKGNSLVRVYRCNQFLQGIHKPDCVKRMKVKMLDEMLWERVYQVLNDPQALEEGIQKKINQLQVMEIGAETEIEKIQRSLEDITQERQWVITQARKRSITEEDMNYQLGVLSSQEKEYRRALSDAGLMVGNRAEKLLEFANQYREQLREGLDLLNKVPESEEEERALFDARRHIVETIVKRVNVYKGWTITVEFVFDLSEMVEVKELPF